MGGFETGSMYVQYVQGIQPNVTARIACKSPTSKLCRYMDPISLAPVFALNIVRPIQAIVIRYSVLRDFSYHVQLSFHYLGKTTNF